MGRVRIERPKPENARDADIRSYPVKAGESVQAGDVVDVDGGTVCSEITPIISAGAASPYGEGGGGTFSSLCSLNDNMAIVVYRYGNVVRYILVKMDGNIVTYAGRGTAIGSYSSEGYGPVVVKKISSTKFLVAGVNQTDGKRYFVIGTVDGENITFGEEKSVGSSSGDISSLCVLVLSEEMFIASWMVNSSMDVYRFQLSGSMISGVTNVGSIPQSGTRSNSVAISRMGSGYVCLCYSNGADKKLRGVVLAIKGTAITIGTPAVIGETDSSSAISCIYSDPYVVVGHRDYSTGKLAIKVLKAQSETTLAIMTDITPFDGIGATGVFSMDLVGRYIVFMTGQGLCGTVQISGEELYPKSLIELTDQKYSVYAVSGMMNDGSILACYEDRKNGNASTAIVLNIRNGEIGNEFVNVSTQAIALTSGSGGQNVDVLFDGTAELPGVKAGTSITSPGVRGYSPIDGWIWVKPWWEERPCVIGSYVPNNGTGIRTISLGFSPSAILFWPYKKSEGMGSYYYNEQAGMGEMKLLFQGQDFKIMSGGKEYASLKLNGQNIEVSGYFNSTTDAEEYHYIAFRE